MELNGFGNADGEFENKVLTFCCDCGVEERNKENKNGP